MILKSYLNYLQFEKRFSPHTVMAYSQDLYQFSNYLVEQYQIVDLHAAISERLPAGNAECGVQNTVESELSWQPWRGQYRAWLH